ncbi:hypothetical protein KCU67_g3943, partial [Aureobasidium melanogenum]
MKSTITSALTSTASKADASSSITVTSTEITVPLPSSTEDSQPEPEDEGCISDKVGLCSNGNYPIWDPATGTISCDVSWDDIDDTMSDCQRVAETQFNLSMQAIDCDESSCPAAKRRSLEKRGTKRKSSSNPSFGNIAGGSCNKRHKSSPFSLDGQPGKCDATFHCDTDRWPNVCNNARSAIEKRAYKSILTYRARADGKDLHLVQSWDNTHANWGLRPDNNLAKSRYYNYGGPNGRKFVAMAETSKTVNGVLVRPKRAGRMVDTPPNEKYNSPKGPSEGWGLIGCDVEEYPFGNSQLDPNPSWFDRDFENGKVFPVLRLIPSAENQNHGRILGNWIRDVKTELQRQNSAVPATFSYCIDFTGSQKDRNDYCLESGNDDYCYNACAIPYGADFTLVNHWKDPSTGDIRYDPWFDEQGRTFKHTTKSVLGKDPETTNLPSQYGKFHPLSTSIAVEDVDKDTGRYPSPGHKTYVGDMAARPLTGQWQLGNVESAFAVSPWFAQNLPVVVGIPAPRKDSDSKNLIYDDYPGYSASAGSDDEDGDAMDTSAKVKRYVAHADARRTSRSGYSPIKNSIDHSTIRLSRRGVLSGSWLDPRVYSEILKCDADPDPDYADEEEPDTQDELLTSLAVSSSMASSTSMTTTANLTMSASSSTSLAATTTASSTTSSTTFIESLTASSCYPSTAPTSTDGAKEIEFSVANAAINKF